MFKKIFLVMVLIFGLTAPSHAAFTTWTFNGLTGGTAALDGRNVASLEDGHLALGYSGTTYYVYKYDASSAAAESSPTVIIPNDNATGTGAWIQINVGTGDVTLTGEQTLTNKTLTSPVINTPTGIVTGDLTESTDKKYVTDAQQVILGNTSGTNSGDNAANSTYTIGSATQAWDTDLDTYAGITPSANVQSFLGAATYAAMLGLLDLEVGTDFYSTGATDTLLDAKEDSLGNPGTDDYILSSKTDGTRSWVAPGSGGMVYPDAGIPVSVAGTSWGTSLAIGADIQAYDADTAKKDLANTWAEVQTFTKAPVFSVGFTVTEQADPDYTDFREGTTNGGTYKHRLVGGDYSAYRESALPDYAVEFPNAAAVNSTGAIAVDASGFDGQLATTDDTLQEVAQKVDDLDIPTDDDAIEFVIDGGGSAIETGLKGFLEVPYACTINSVTLLADQSGSIVVDVWKDTYVNYPPADADSITSSAVPTISTAVKAQDTTLTGWTTSLSKGDILAFNVDSITTCERVTISLRVDK